VTVWSDVWICFIRRVLSFLFPSHFWLTDKKKVAIFRQLPPLFVFVCDVCVCVCVCVSAHVFMYVGMSFYEILISGD